MTLWTRCGWIFVMAVMSRIVNIHSRPEHLALDFDDRDFYLSALGPSPPSFLIESLRRGHDSLLVKLQELTKTLKDDEVKLNNVFYKLGHHETSIRKLSNSINHMTATSNTMEAKLNKHAFNVDHLRNYLEKLGDRVDKQENAKIHIQSLRDSINHLEDRLSEALVKLRALENSTDFMKKGQISPRARNIQYQHGDLLYASQSPASFVFKAPKTSGDLCAPDWHLINGRCYWISNKEALNFLQSLAACAKKGGQLLSYLSGSILKDLKSTNSVVKGKKYWTSGTNIFPPNDWIFLFNGNEIPEELWGSTSLFNQDGSKCAVIDKNSLEAFNCSQPFPYICESWQTH